MHHGAQGSVSQKIKNEINVTPLVDVVLVLLIIFMVVTPMLHRGVEIVLPDSANHEKKTDTGEQLVITVRKDGVYVESDRLEGTRRTDRFKDELKHQARPVHVRADRGLSFGDVRVVLDELHEMGALNVGLATQEKGE